MFLRLALVLGLSFSGSAFAVSWYTSECAAHYGKAFATMASVAADYCAGYASKPGGACTVSLNFSGAGTAVNTWYHAGASKVFTQCSGTSAVNGSPSTLGEFYVANYVTGASCPSPLVLWNGVCTEQAPDLCPAKTGQSAIPSGQVGYGTSAEGTNPINAVLCDGDSCLIEVQQATAIPIGGGQQGNYISQARFTGVKATGACPLVVIAPTPKDPSLPKPIDSVTPDANTPDGVPTKGDDCPVGSAFGQVNGVNVCSPAGTKIAYVPDTTTQTNNGVETTSTVSKTSEVMPDGSVKTTSTITTSSGGVGSVTSTSKTSGGPSSINGRDGKDGDSIDGIDLGPAPSAESTMPGQFLPGPGPGQDGAGQAARTFAVQAKITGGSSACIADRSVTAMGVTVTIPLSALCPWFAVMYNLVSAFAVFSALRILVMS